MIRSSLGPLLPAALSNSRLICYFLASGWVLLVGALFAIVHWCCRAFIRIDPIQRRRNDNVNKSCVLESGGTKRDKLKGTNARNSQFFADFRRFLLIFAFSWELQHFGGADFRRKPQETADFRRKPQKPQIFAENPFCPI